MTYATSDSIASNTNWIALAQHRDKWQLLLNAVMNLWVPLNAGNLLTSCGPLSFSGRALLLGVSSRVYLTLKRVHNIKSNQCVSSPYPALNKKF
jgi:hypothetical protein